MRTSAWKTAPQIALRDCSKQVVREGQYIRFWWRTSPMQSSTHFAEGFLLVRRSWCHHEGFSAFLNMKRCKDWDLEVSSWKHISKDLFHHIPWSTECHIHLLNCLEGILKVNSCSCPGFNLSRGRWQTLDKHQFVVDPAWYSLNFWSLIPLIPDLCLFWLLLFSC